MILAGLPVSVVATPAQVMHLIDREKLFGIGIGYVDAHLLAATRLTPDATLWTRDKRPASAADRLGIGARMAH